ncbi:MAG: methyltransferase domain-containing protein [Bacteroidota bacterium]
MGFLTDELAQEASEQQANIQAYYDAHARVYDLSRWSFLFGRKALVRELPFASEDRFDLLEVGCGTGYNLKRLHQQYPKAHLTGLDVSAQMIERSKKKFSSEEQVSFVEAPYTSERSFPEGFDVVLFSYCLTMINPQWGDMLQTALGHVRPGGYLAMVDFHDSRFPWFKRWMERNHVRMDRHLLPVLEQQYEPIIREVKTGYGGIWAYVKFVGRKHP